MLFVTGIEAAKPRDKPYKLTDGSGLHLLINPNGSKLWRFRHRFCGKQLMLSLGSYPEVSLSSARQKRDEALRLVAEGKIPSEQRREDRLKAQTQAANTFGEIASELINKLEAEGKAPATIDKQKWFLLLQDWADLLDQFMQRLVSTSRSRFSRRMELRRLGKRSPAVQKRRQVLAFFAKLKRSVVRQRPRPAGETCDARAPSQPPIAGVGRTHRPRRRPRPFHRERNHEGSAAARPLRISHESCPTTAWPPSFTLTCFSHWPNPELGAILPERSRRP